MTPPTGCGLDGGFAVEPASAVVNTVLLRTIGACWARLPILRLLFELCSLPICATGDLCALVWQHVSISSLLTHELFHETTTFRAEMALTLPAPTTTTTRGEHNFALQPTMNIRTLFPNLPQEKINALEAFVRLDGPALEQRTEFSIQNATGQMTHYTVVYDPSVRTLRWRIIAATVAVPAVYDTVCMQIGDKWKGWSGWGKKKPVYGDVQVARGLSPAEISQVWNHLSGAVNLAIAQGAAV